MNVVGLLRCSMFMVSLVIVGSVSLHAGETSQPNIVFVLIDDLGWQDFSCFGNDEAKTPNIDRLASEGLRFSQFYVNAPICSPSRCAFTTGQYPHRWRITSYLSHRADNLSRGIADWLDPKAPSLAKTLKSHGYVTGHFGKWHLGGQRDVDNAPAIAAYGFDESLTNFEGLGPKLLPLTRKPGDTVDGRIWADAVRLGGPVTWMQRSEITGGFVGAAVDFMNRASEQQRPFYINVWPDDVHSPFWPPVDKWAEGKRGSYLAVLESMDKQLGRLFNHIRDNPKLCQNTLVIVCSDNGPEPRAGRATPLRGAKGQLYEGGIRSPLIVWGPGIVAREAVGTMNDTSVFAAFDIVPSLLSLASVESQREQTLDGESLLSTLIGKSTASRAQPIFWRRPPDRKTMPPAITRPQPDLAVRDGRWKLLCDYDGKNPELYDLMADPTESTNIASVEPDVVGRLAGSVTQWNAGLPQDRGRELGAAALASQARRQQSKPMQKQNKGF